MKIIPTQKIEKINNKDDMQIYALVKGNKFGSIEKIR
jgi:hypothetical protein